MAGWYDVFLQPMLDTFQGYQNNSVAGALGKQQLIVGPRGHCVMENYIDFDDDFINWKWGYDISVDIFLSQNSESSQSPR